MGEVTLNTLINHLLCYGNWMLKLEKIRPRNFKSYVNKIILFFTFNIFSLTKKLQQIVKFEKIFIRYYKIQRIFLVYSD